MSEQKRYHQAAVTYLVYGLVYLAGAVYIAEVGLSERAESGLVWFLIGALFVLVFPALIWKGYKWFTRILAVLVLVRMAGLVEVILDEGGRMVPLPWGGGLPMGYGAAVFLLVAAVTCFMLARAGWSLEVPKRTASGS